MIIRWYRKGLFAGAIGAVFVTSVTPTTTLQQYQLRPDFRFEYRYVTPISAVSTLIRSELQPDIRFNFQHVTPAEAPPAAAVPKHRGFTKNVGRLLK